MLQSPDENNPGNFVSRIVFYMKVCYNVQRCNKKHGFPISALCPVRGGAEDEEPRRKKQEVHQHGSYIHEAIT